MKKRFYELQYDDIFYLPVGVLAALYPDNFYSMALKENALTPVHAFHEMQVIFSRYIPDECSFHSFEGYIRYVLDFIEGDAPEFSAYFLDKLHELEIPSSSLRL